MVAFIDDHRGEYGVEPIWAVLPTAPSTHYESDYPLYAYVIPRR